MMSSLTVAPWGYTVAGCWLLVVAAAMFLAAGAGRMRDVVRRPRSRR